MKHAIDLVSGDRVLPGSAMKPSRFRHWLGLVESTAVPRLFHGSSARHLPAIRRHGLRAAPTQPKSGPVRHGVYLTDDIQHAIDYATLACDLLADGRDDALLVLDVLSQTLNPALLLPDDYDLHDAIQGGERPGTEPVDPRLARYTRWQDVDWRLSLAVTHQVFYAAAIPAAALRVVTL